MLQLAVITTDLIDSTSLDPKELERVMKALKGELYELKQVGEIRHYELYRGDAAQMIVPDPVEALKVAYRLKTAVNRITPGDKTVRRGMKVQRDLRLAVGVGSVSRQDVSRLTNEEPFVRSGRELERINEEGVTTGVVIGHRQADRELRTELFLYEGIARQWTLSTAEVVYYKLKGWPERKIGERLDISQSSVNQHSQAAYWNGLNLLLNRYEELIGELSS